MLDNHRDVVLPVFKERGGQLIKTIGDAFGIGYLWAAFEPQRRTWHDLIAGTKVVLAE